MRVLVAMGSNLGNREASLAGAVRRMGEVFGAEFGGALKEVSGLYETDPVGGPMGQGRYLNAVASLRCSASPLEILSVLQRLENEAGRVRAERWGPRPLDLDLLWIDAGPQEPDSAITVQDPPLLEVPHPRMWERSFVLLPLADVAPDLVDIPQPALGVELVAEHWVSSVRGAEPR